MGNNPHAIRFYERARLATRPDENTAILNPLASAYYGDSRLDKAREILELSLQVDPEQPEVRRLLNEVLGRGGGGSR